MYVPADFKITDKAEIFSFIEGNSFGQLISVLEGKLTCTHMPFLVNNDKTKLLGHLARTNPQHRDIEDQEVLITLEGPHDYISPSWYTSPGVPTWNYQAVNIYGICRVFNDTADLKSLVDQLTYKYEQALIPSWQPQYNQAMLKHIVGIEITISDTQCKYKLSQNKSQQDREQIIAALGDVQSHKLADAMKKWRYYNV